MYIIFKYLIMLIIYKPGASCDRQRHRAARAGEAVAGVDESWRADHRHGGYARSGDDVAREKCKLLNDNNAIYWVHQWLCCQ